VFALFWFFNALIWIQTALGLPFIFPFALLGAVGVEELIQEYDYANDFSAEDYPTPGSRPTDSEIPIRHC
jgi:hypothetical protein